ncbi:MAG: hypothetical protein HYZ20_19635 [Burkholderiales bacterium]|nr:hypothetical protein [Burkholderiales bacterium]
MSLLNTSDTTWRVLTTTKNNGGTTSSQFQYQFVIGIKASTRQVGASNSMTALDSGVISLIPGLNFVAVAYARNIATRVTVNGRYAGTTDAMASTAADGTCGIGYTRYSGYALSPSVAVINALAVLPYAADDALAAELTHRFRELFQKRRIMVPRSIGAAAPTLSDLKAVSITSSTVQGTYDYAF